MATTTTKTEGNEEEKEKQKTVNVNVDGVTWRRGEMIGKGSFGSVYLATLKKKPKSQLCYCQSQCQCHFPPQMAVKSAELSVSRSLQKEREILNNLHLQLQLQGEGRRGCPYIIQCFGEEITTGEKGEPVYNLLLEYASGGSLRDLIKKSNGFGLRDSDIRRYARSILRAIKHVHDSGYVHLDIKPDNILLVPTKSKGKKAPTKVKKFVAKVCDFGLAKMVKQQIKKKKSKLSGYIRGTAMYISPEAVIDGIQEAPSDIWAIGCVVLEMLTGKRVWDRKQHWNTEKLLYNIGYEFDIPEIPSGISEQGKDFLKGCFLRNPADRLTADMLLKLPFVSQADDDDDHEDVQVQVLNLKESLDAQGVSTMLSLSETDEDDSWLVEPTMISEDNIDSLLVEHEPSIISEYEEEPSICYEYNNDGLLDEPGIISEDEEEEPSICPSSEAVEDVDADEHKKVQALKESSDTQWVSSMSEETDNDSDSDEDSSSDEAAEEEDEDEDHSINHSSEAVESVGDSDGEDAEAEVLKRGRFDPKEVNYSTLSLSDTKDDESWSDESSFGPKDHKRRSPVAGDDETMTQDHKRRKLMPTSSVAAMKQMMMEFFVANHQPKPVKAIPQEPPSTLPITTAH